MPTTPRIPNPYVDIDAAYKKCIIEATLAINEAIEHPTGAGARSQDATTAMALVLLAGEFRAIKIAQQPSP